MEPKGETPQSPAAALTAVRQAKMTQRPNKLNRNHLSAILLYYDGSITKQSYQLAAVHIVYPVFTNGSKNTASVRVLEKLQLKLQLLTPCFYKFADR